MEELVILVDQNDQAIGQMEKLEAHVRNLTHRAFSVILIDGNGDLILQKRALGKYHSPGLWTNACCGHPRPQEETIDAAKRRTQEELGISVELEELFSFTYEQELQKGLWENEYDHVFLGTYDQPIKHFNLEEVSELKTVSLLDLQQDIIENPTQYTHWFKIIIPRLLDVLVQS